jgi:hypothetical protein
MVIPAPSTLTPIDFDRFCSMEVGLGSIDAAAVGASRKVVKVVKKGT